MNKKEDNHGVNVKAIKSRSIKGTISLISRSAVVQVISSIGFLLLTIFLNRSDVGLFFAITEIVAILGYFSDIGLAAALIQKKTQPNTRDLRTTFTVQQILVLTLIIIVIALTPMLRHFYSLPASGTYLLFALLIGFFLASLKTIPSILLERSLQFEKLAIIEIAESLVFYSIAVSLAKYNFGLYSYAAAIIARGITGTIALYVLSPWPIGFEISVSSIKDLLKFGVPYQLNTFLAVIKDRFTNLMLFRIIGSDGIGILGWAQTWAQKPLRFIMDNITKVSFPAFSRLQSHPRELKSAIEKSLFFSCSAIFPILASFAITAGRLISAIPKYRKWEIALIPLYIYLLSAALAAISTPLTNLLNAIGKIKITFYLMIMWTVVTVVLMPLLAMKYGFIGAAYATGIIALTSIIPVIITRKYIDFSLSYTIIKPAAATMIMGIYILFMQKMIPGILGTVAALSTGTAVYLLAVILINGIKIIPEIISHVKEAYK